MRLDPRPDPTYVLAVARDVVAGKTTKADGIRVIKNRFGCYLLTAKSELDVAIAALAASPAASAPAADEDGNCTRCGETFGDPSKVTHECPPGFTTPLHGFSELFSKIDLRASGATIYAFDENGVNLFSAFLGGNNGHRPPCEEIAAEIVRRWHSAVVATDATIGSRPDGSRREGR